MGIVSQSEVKYSDAEYRKVQQSLVMWRLAEQRGV